jgi:hypothetical protein
MPNQLIDRIDFSIQQNTPALVSHCIELIPLLTTCHAPKCFRPSRQLYHVDPAQRLACDTLLRDYLVRDFDSIFLNEMTAQIERSTYGNGLYECRILQLLLGGLSLGELSSKVDYFNSPCNDLEN